MNNGAGEGRAHSIWATEGDGRDQLDYLACIERGAPDFYPGSVPRRDEAGNALAAGGLTMKGRWAMMWGGATHPEHRH